MTARPAKRAGKPREWWIVTQRFGRRESFVYEQTDAVPPAIINVLQGVNVDDFDVAFAREAVLPQKRRRAKGEK